MTIDNTESQMRKGLLELWHTGYYTQTKRGIPQRHSEPAEGRKTCGTGGYAIPVAYPPEKMLGCSNYRWEESPSGPPRKYYSLTRDGIKFYAHLRSTWDELSEAVNYLTTSL